MLFLICLGELTLLLSQLATIVLLSNLTFNFIRDKKYTEYIALEKCTVGKRTASCLLIVLANTENLK